MTKSYCTQNNGDCSTCSLVNYNRDCRNIPVPVLCGYKEAAEIMGVDKKALAVYIKRGWPGGRQFPEPVQRLASGPVWRKSDIIKFKEEL